MLAVNTKICDLCGTCVAVCPDKALLMRSEVSVDTAQCTECGICVHVCPVAALKLTGGEK